MTGGADLVVTARRTAVLGELAGLVTAAGPAVQVAIDGVDGAGKSVLGDELAATLRARGRTVVRASVDGFHNPPALRYRRGRDSPLGYFEDSYDYAALARELLDPLRPGGSRRYRTAIYDVHGERSTQQAQSVAPNGCVLVLDGILLHRPEVRARWDLSIFVRVPFEVSVPRGAARGYGHPSPGHLSNRRYVEGQRHYLATCDPEGRADVVIDNTDLACPVIVGPRERPA